MVVTFSIGFILIFGMGAANAKEDNELLRVSIIKNSEKVFVDGKRSPGRVQADELTAKPSELFGTCFLIWITAIVCWIIDILMCEYL